MDTMGHLKNYGTQGGLIEQGRDLTATHLLGMAFSGMLRRWSQVSSRLDRKMSDDRYVFVEWNELWSGEAAGPCPGSSDLRLWMTQPL